MMDRMGNVLSFMGEAFGTFVVWVVIVFVIDLIASKLFKFNLLPPDTGSFSMDLFQFSAAIMKIAIFATLIGALFDGLEWTKVTAVGILFLCTLIFYPFAKKKEAKLKTK